MAARRGRVLSRALARDCDEAAAAIVADCLAIAPADGSLRGAAALLLAARELGIRDRRRHAWIATTRAGLEEMDASFFDGVLGSAWLLARIGEDDLDWGALDAGVLDLLSTPWEGGMAPFAGGLVGIGLYGLTRGRARAGRRIVARCVELFEALAMRSRSGVRWLPGAASLPENVRASRARWRLCNMEGSAAVVAFLAAAARAGVARALPLARAGARTLASDAFDDRTANVVGVATHHRVLGTVHGSGTWALGSAGAIAALLGVARATARRCDLDAAVDLGTKLADADPAACHAGDASLGTGTAGIAVVLHALYETAGLARFRIAAEYWYRRTLACRTPRAGLGGYRYQDVLHDASEPGAHPGLLEGAVGTALALRCVGRGTKSDWRAFLLM